MVLPCPGRPKLEIDLSMLMVCGYDPTITAVMAYGIYE